LRLGFVKALHETLSLVALGIEACLKLHRLAPPSCSRAFWAVAIAAFCCNASSNWLTSSCTWASP
jgi:hypothetical protein